MAIITISQCVSANATTHHLLLSVYSVSTSTTGSTNSGQYPWLISDIKSYPFLRWTVEVQKGVTRPAAAVRQPGTEMNEMYGMSASEVISQDNPVQNYYPYLSRTLVMQQVWRSYPNLSLDMHYFASLDILSQLFLGHPNQRNIYWDLQGYSDLPRVWLFQMLASSLYQLVSSWQTLQSDKSHLFK